MCVVKMSCELAARAKKIDNVEQQIELFSFSVEKFSVYSWWKKVNCGGFVSIVGQLRRSNCGRRQQGRREPAPAGQKKRECGKRRRVGTHEKCEAAGRYAGCEQELYPSLDNAGATTLPGGPTASAAAVAKASDRHWRLLKHNCPAFIPIFLNNLNANSLCGKFKLKSCFNRNALNLALRSREKPSHNRSQ